MQLKLPSLVRHCESSLQKVYLVSGDETLLVEEACDLILKSARAQGFSERTVLHTDGRFSWSELNQSASSLSLFAERRIIDVRATAKALNKQASEAIRSYLENPPEDVLLLIRCNRLESSKRSSAWCKAIDKAGAVLMIWPVGHEEFPGWLNTRARQIGITLQADAAEFLCSHLEGNLLAAVQELEGLKLIGAGQALTLDQVRAAVEDSSHYDVFELVDAMMASDVGRIPKIVRTLNQEGLSLFAVMGALTSQIRVLKTGRSSYGPKQQIRQDFARRVGTRGLDSLLAEFALIDRQAKGALHGDAWQSLERIVLRAAGRRSTPLLGASRDLLRRF